MAYTTIIALKDALFAFDKSVLDYKFLNDNRGAFKTASEITAGCQSALSNSHALFQILSPTKVKVLMPLPYLNVLKGVVDPQELRDPKRRGHQETEVTAVYDSLTQRWIADGLYWT